MSETRIALLKQLLEAGVHFGHKKNRWNPKMKQYIFGARNGIYVIDLQKTADAIQQVCDALRDIVTGGGKVLFVGTKKQAQDIIRQAAERTGMYYVNERWLGGMLTNFQTIQKSINRLLELERMRDDGTFEVLSKKEVSQLTKEMNKLAKNLTGVREMKGLPQAVFVVDVKTEEIAFKEAVKLSIPVVALVDTNSDPEGIDYVIPGNDDAIRSIKLVTNIIADTIAEAREKYIKEYETKKKSEEASGAGQNSKKDKAKPSREENAKGKQSASGKGDGEKKLDKTPAESSEDDKDQKQREIERLADEALQMKDGPSSPQS